MNVSLKDPPLITTVSPALHFLLFDITQKKKKAKREKTFFKKDWTRKTAIVTALMLFFVYTYL